MSIDSWVFSDVYLLMNSRKADEDAYGKAGRMGG